MRNEIYLSVIIPAYNEEKRLTRTLEEIDKYLRTQTYDYEIIVVNSGSTDRTAEIVKEKQKAMKNLNLLEVENRGKGYAVKQGMLKAQGKFRLFTDADNSTSIDQVEKMWSWFEKGYDLVIGSRDMKGAVLDPPQPCYRRLLGLGFRFLAHLICGTWGILDTQCGFKCFREKAGKDIFSKSKVNGFSFDVEVIMLAKRLGYKIKEIPIHWKNDPESKVKFKHIFEMGLDLFKIRWAFLKKQYGLPEK